MDGHRELHLRVRGTQSLRLPGKPLEPLNVYCVASYGHVRHRTRLIEGTLSPDWNEEFVFDADTLTDSTSAIDPVIKFEIFSPGLWRDESLFCAYLDLGVSGLLDNLQQQQQLLQDAAVRHSTSTIRSHRNSSTAADNGTVLPGEDTSAVDVATAASRRGSDTATIRVSGAAAADKSTTATASAAFRSGCNTAGTGFSTEIQTRMLPLLAVRHGSSSSSFQSKSVTGERSLVTTRLRRSGNHVRNTEGGELEVAAWWVQQPSLSNAGTPPRMISFVHPPGMPHPLPSATHTTLSSQWEEPALAFVRVVVNSVDLGSAAAAAGTVSGSTMQHSKFVLRRLKALLKGDFEAEQQEQQRPTLSDIHRPASLSITYRQDAAVAASGAAQGLASQYVLEYQGFDDVEEPFGSGSDDDSLYPEDISQLGSSRSGGWKGKSSQKSSHHMAGSLGHERVQGFRQSNADEGLTGDEGTPEYTPEATDEDIEIVSLPGFEQGTSASLQQQPHPSISSRKAQRKALNRQRDQQLYLTVKIQIGNQKPKALRPIPLSAEGCADIQQSAVFAVTRPLDNAWISYHIGLGLGPRGVQLLGYRFEYNLLHLLRRSPERPWQLQPWRDVARGSVNGLQVQLPCLPESCLDTSAFLADADYRAGMYLIPPVSPAALAQAARDDADAAAAVAATAAAAAAEQDAEEVMTDSESEAGTADDSASQVQAATDGNSGTGSVYASSRVSESGSAASAATAASGSLRGVLRRRAAADGPAKQPLQQQQQQQQPGKGRTSDSDSGVKRGRPRPQWQEKLKDRASAGVDKVLVRVEGRFNQALDKLPDGVAKNVKESNFMKRVLPSARHSEVFSLGQLRVPTFKKPAAAAAAAAGSSTTNAQPPSTFQSASSPVYGMDLHQHGSHNNERSGNDTGIAEAGCHPAAAAAAVALQDHPNVATAGGPATRPLGILQLTLQAITVRTSISLVPSTSGVQLLMRCGPHWLQLQQAALPISFHNASGNSTNTTNIAAASSSSIGPSDQASLFTAASSGVSGSKVAPVQVLVPVFGSSSLVTLVIHRRGSVIGRCVFKLYGLLPLLLRDYTKTLTLYSDKRGPGGQRVIAGSILVRLAAGPPAGCSRLTACIRLAYSYLITPHTFEMHTSGVLATMSREERDEAGGEVIVDWLAAAGQQGKQALPESLVDQLVSTGRSQVSGSRMRGHVRRIKAVLLDWLPRRYDPLAFYYWKRPTHNLLALWVISHVCLYPAKWLFVISLLVTLTLLRRMAIQIRRGVLGFELEQLPLDMAAAAGLPHQQQQEQPGAEPSGEGCSPSDCGESADSVECPTGLRSHGAQFGDMLNYKEAADKLRAKISAAAAGKSKTPATPPQPSAFPKTLQDLRQQLEAGTLDLDSLDVEALAERLLSVGGLLKLARQHSVFVWSYALVAQNMLDDAAGFAEGLYAMLTAQDPLAALLFCGMLMSSATFCYIFGVGAGIFLIVCVLLRPPLLRGVPGVFGWKALFANLPTRSVEELAW